MSEQSRSDIVRCSACNLTIARTVNNLYQARFIDRSPDATEVAELYLCDKCADGLAHTLQDEVLRA